MLCNIRWPGRIRRLPPHSIFTHTRERSGSRNCSQPLRARSLGYYYPAGPWIIIIFLVFSFFSILQPHVQRSSDTSDSSPSQLQPPSIITIHTVRARNRHQPSNPHNIFYTQPSHHLTKCLQFSNVTINMRHPKFPVVSAPQLPHLLQCIIRLKSCTCQTRYLSPVCLRCLVVVPVRLWSGERGNSEWRWGSSDHHYHGTDI